VVYDLGLIPQYKNAVYHSTNCHHLPLSIKSIFADIQLYRHEKIAFIQTLLLAHKTLNYFNTNEEERKPFPFILH